MLQVALVSSAPGPGQEQVDGRFRGAVMADGAPLGLAMSQVVLPDASGRGLGQVAWVWALGSLDPWPSLWRRDFPFVPRIMG